MLHTCNSGERVSSSASANPGFRRALLKRVVAGCGIAVGLIIFSGLPLQAQVKATHRGIVVVRQFTNDESPRAVAVDASGNVYSTASTGAFTILSGPDQNGHVVTSGPDGNSYKDTLQPDGTYSGSVLVSNLSNPIGIAVDGGGSVYIADSAPPSDGHWNCPGRLLSRAPGGSLNQSPGYCRYVFPQGLASYGRSFFLGAPPHPEYYDPTGELSRGETAMGGVLRKADFENTPIAIAQGPSAFGIAVDAGGHVYYTADVDGFARIVGGATIATGLNEPKGIAVDRSGNVFISDTGNSQILVVTPNGAGGFNPPVVLLNDQNDGIYRPAGLAVDQKGNLYIAAGCYFGIAAVVRVTLSGGGLDLGTAAPDVGHDGVLNFSFNAPVTLNATTPFQVLTQGASGQDFTDETMWMYIEVKRGGDCGWGNCNTCRSGQTYNAGASCNVAAQFSPLYSGTRNGAVVLLDSAGNTVGTGYLRGAGKAAQITFSAGTQSTVASGFQALNGVAVDGSGNVYIVDTNNRTVLKETPSGSGYTQSVVAFGLVYPNGVALDGAGNVYISDGTGANARVLKETPLGSGYTQSVVADNSTTYGLIQPLGVAVDGSGNVYIVDAGSNQRVVKETRQPDGSYTQSVVVAGLYNPSYVAVDGSGNVYIADTFNHRVLKETPQSNGTYAQSVVVDSNSSPNPFSQPRGVAVDGSGNIYIAASGRVLKETWSGSGYAQSVVADGSAAFGLVSPMGIAVDRVGNVYIADAGFTKRVLKENRADAPVLDFGYVIPGTTSAPQSVEIINNGNDTLIFSGLTVDSPFTQLLGSGTLADCRSNSQLSPGAACNLSITFTPGSGGSFSGNATLRNNSYNYGWSTTQFIALRGSGGRLSQTISFPNPGTQTYGVAPITLTATASSGLPITYAVVSGPATLSGSTLTVRGAGSITVQADQAGNDTYQPAPPVRVTFTVNPKPASVTPNAATKVYGTADPALTGTISGFLTTDNVTATYSRTAGETVVGSPYTISAVLSPAGVLGNYAITYNTAAFTINKAAARVMATNNSKTYGTSDPILGATQTGFTAADAAAITLSASRVVGEAVGTYVITPAASGTALSNYTVSYVTGTFTIYRATPTITWANPADIICGTPLSGIQLNGTANVTGSFTYTPPSGTVLNVGNGQILSVSFIPTDTANYNSASKTVTINVQQASAAQLVQTLILDVKNLKLPNGTEQSLVTKLDNALKSLEKGQKNAAANQINAFINEVNAQRNKKLTAQQADDLIAKANRIILLIGA